MKIELGILIVICAILVTGCGTKEAIPPDEVTLQLKWLHQAQFAGYYVAAQKGFYADENIAITINPGGFNVDYFDLLNSGQADFAVVRPEGILQERANGNPLVAIATIFQRNPFVLITLEESGIETPFDFPGHTLSVSDSSQAQLMSMFRVLNIDPSTIETVEYEFDYAPFYAGEIDIKDAFAAGSLLEVRRQGVEINVIWPDDYGVHWYSDTIATTDDLLEENPDLAERFLRATLRGHQFAIENPEEAVDITMLYAEVQDVDIQMKMLLAGTPLIHTGNVEIGWMDYDVWKNMMDDLIAYEILEAPIDLEKVFTLSILEALEEPTE